MRLHVYPSKLELGKAAAREAADKIRDAVAARGKARIIAATGASQFEFLDALTASPDLPWEAVEMFHLDEYIGLPATHPASFRKYLKERLIAQDWHDEASICSTASRTPSSSATRPAAHRLRARSTSPSSASARTRTSRSTIRRRISRPYGPTCRHPR